MGIADDEIADNTTVEVFNIIDTEVDTKVGFTEVDIAVINTSDKGDVEVVDITDLEITDVEVFDITDSIEVVDTTDVEVFDITGVEVVDITGIEAIEGVDKSKETKLFT